MSFVKLDLSQDNCWIFKRSLDTIFLQSKLLLNNNFKHAFFTRKTKENDPEFLYKLFGGKSSIHLLHQIHSNKVINASESNLLSSKQGDSLISDKTLQSLWIYSADCIPILLADTKRGNVAAIHSGWKGLAKNNIKSTIKRLEAIGSKKKDLIAAIGPAISQAQYNVGQEVVNSIYKALEQNNSSNNKEISRKMILLK